VGKLFSGRIGPAFVIGEAMRNSIICGIVLILGFASFCLAQMSPDEALQQIKEREAAQQDASQSPTTNPSADFTPEEVAKAHYARQVADAKHDYMTAVIKADETYVASLDAAMKQAMADRNLDLAEKLDAERKDGIARTAQHRALLTGNGTGADVGAAGGTDLNGYRLVKATWYVPGGNDRPVIDVTERIKPVSKYSAIRNGVRTRNCGLTICGPTACLRPLQCARTTISPSSIFRGISLRISRNRQQMRL
jgi:hypothetical protein